MDLLLFNSVMFPRFNGQTFAVGPSACELPTDIATLYDFMQQKLEFAINPHSMQALERGEKHYEDVVVADFGQVSFPSR